MTSFEKSAREQPQPQLHQCHSAEPQAKNLAEIIVSRR
jgi:hypothetical protein